MDGIIVIRKEKGYTSHDVVAKLRGILSMKKIGHTGTLDPEAEGVLPVALGKGTRLVDMLTDKEKTYEAVLRLGVVTDTQDMTGTVLEEHPVDVAEEQIRETVKGFLGEQMQVPPMYSAIKVGGKKLYELARQGKEIERKPRRIHIDSISILDTSHLVDRHEFTMEVRCSKGTYIRTLCNDIGLRLGCGGAMAHLTRTAVGSFHLDTAITLGQLEKLRDEDKVNDVVVPVEDFFKDLDSVHVKSSCRKLIENGNPFTVMDICDAEPDKAQDSQKKDAMYEDGTRVRVYDQDGLFFFFF